MRIAHCLETDIETIAPDQTAADAAAVMAAQNVGALVVIDADRTPVGIVTDRDLAVRVLAAGVPPSTELASVMSAQPLTVQADASVETALDTMRSHGVRRLPVVDADGTLAGIVTLDDVLGVLRQDLLKIEEILRWARPRPTALPL